jgi:hypothetical protein
MKKMGMESMYRRLNIPNQHRALTKQTSYEVEGASSPAPPTTALHQVQKSHLADAADYADQHA